MKKSHKKYLLIALVVVLVLGGTAGRVLWKHFGPISQPEIQKAKTAQRTFVAQDFLHETGDGFSILIPSGHQYAGFKSGPYSLIISADHSYVEVMRFKGRFHKLEDMVALTHGELQKRSYVQSLTPATPITLGTTTGLHFEYLVSTADGGPVERVSVWFKIGNTLYTLMAECPEGHSASITPVQKRIVNSLSVN